MSRLAARLAGLRGWRRHAAAAALGGLAVLALPPVYALPLLVVSFTGLVWLIDGTDGAPRPLRAAFAAGWWFGFAHFAGGLYWITNALFVDAARHGWLAPFAVSGLSVYFALYPALAAALARLAPAGGARVLALAAAWTGAEWLRGVALTGFPWNLMGTTLAFDPAAMQGAALVGTYGLSLIVVAVAAAPATLAGPGRGPGRWAPTALAVLTAAALGAGGWARLVLAPPDPAGESRPRLRIVQAGIDQRLKWRPELARRHFETYLRLSRRPGPPPDALIWPETALPVVYRGGAGVDRALAAAAPPGGVLVTGALTAGAGGAGPPRNSVLAVTAAGPVARYDKHHLVPFGEYVPLRSLNPFPKITEGRTDLVPGPGPRTLHLPGLPPASPLVCYEVIFPAAVTAAGPRPGWLLNLTNDAWFGVSSGPYQHLAAARLRAVEEGLPLVRAANTGVSAVIGPRGRLLAQLPLGARDVIDAALPAPTAGPPPYARSAGLAPAVPVALAVLGAALAARRRRRARAREAARAI